MCVRGPNEPWWSFAWRQLCEKTQYVLAVCGFAMLFWYADKADKNEQRLIDIINTSHHFRAEQTKALQELTFYIKTLKK